MNLPFTALGTLLYASLLLSCQGHFARSAVLPAPQELSRMALVLEEGPDGAVTHMWRPAAEFHGEMRKLKTPDAHAGSLAPILLAGGRQRDCDQEQIDCHRDCMRRKLPAPHDYLPRGHPRHNQLCRDKCLTPYMDCVDAQKVRAQRFSSVDNALDWLKTHRTQLLVGAVVVIAGVTFVVVSAGVGLVVLAPVVLMATGDTSGPLLFSEELR